MATDKLASEFGRRGGKARSAAKTAACRENGGNALRAFWAKVRSGEIPHPRKK